MRTQNKKEAWGKMKKTKNRSKNSGGAMCKLATGRKKRRKGGVLTITYPTKTLKNKEGEKGGGVTSWRREKTKKRRLKRGKRVGTEQKEATKNTNFNKWL